MKTTLTLLAAMLASAGSSTYGLDLAVAGPLVGNLRKLDEMLAEDQTKDQPANGADFGGGKSYEATAANKEDFAACLQGSWNWPNCR